MEQNYFRDLAAITRQQLCISSFQDWTGAALNRSIQGLIDHVDIGSVFTEQLLEQLKATLQLSESVATAWYDGATLDCAIAYNILLYQRDQALRGVSPVVPLQEREHLRPFHQLGGRRHRSRLPVSQDSGTGQPYRYATFDPRPSRHTTTGVRVTSFAYNEGGSSVLVLRCLVTKEMQRVWVCNDLEVGFRLRFRQCPPITGAPYAFVDKGSIVKHTALRSLIQSML